MRKASFQELEESPGRIVEQGFLFTEDSESRGGDSDQAAIASTTGQPVN